MTCTSPALYFLPSCNNIQTRAHRLRVNRLTCALPQSSGVSAQAGAWRVASLAQNRTAGPHTRDCKAARSSQHTRSKWLPAARLVDIHLMAMPPTSARVVLGKVAVAGKAQTTDIASAADLWFFRIKPTLSVWDPSGRQHRSFSMSSSMPPTAET